MELESLKGSEKLKIEAAVLEVLEVENFSLDKDLGITPSAENPDRWIMAFQNKKCKFENLANVRQILGQKFSIEITSKSKENFLIRIEAPSGEFIRFGQSLRPLSAASQGQISSQIQGPRHDNTPTNIH